MALIKQLVDIPTTTGIDSKTDSVNDIPPALSDLENLRFTHTGAFNPRDPFTSLQALSATSTGFVVEARDGAFSLVDAYLYKTVSGAHTQLAPMWSPKGRNYVLGGNYATLGGGTSKVSSVTLTDGSIFTVWATSTPGFAYQFLGTDGESLTGGQSAYPDFKYLIATAGPSGSAFVWIVSSSNELVCRRVSSAGVAVIAVPSITSIDRLSITYSSGDSAWYAIYSASSNTTVNKMTLSGSTLSSAATATAVAASSTDVDVIRSTNYVVIAYWSSTTITVKYLNTSLTTQATQTRTPTVSSPSHYIGFGICETATDTIFCSVTTIYDTTGATLHAFLYTTGSATTVWDANPVGFLSPTAPIYVNSRIYLYAVDMALTGSQTAGLVQIANYDGGTIAKIEAAAFWAADTASLASLVGSFADPWYSVRSRMAKTSSILAVPYHFLGGFDRTATTTSGNTASSVSAQVVADYTVGPVLAAVMRFETGTVSHVRGLDISTSSILTATAMRSVDGAGQGPASPWCVPYIFQKELVAAGSLDLTATYTYVFVKVWSDLQGNRQTLESLPIRVTTGTFSATNYQSFKFYLPVEAFTVYNTASNALSSAVIEVYRTEGNGSVPYRLAVLTTATTMPYTDTAADSDLTLQVPLPSSSGELTSTVPPASKAATMWKGRLAVLPYDDDRKVYYTKPVESLAFPSFAAGLEVSFPQTSSPLTALGTMDGVLYAFTENQVYTVYGDPAGNTGEGGSLSVPEIRFNGVGCVDPASVILTPLGLMFKSNKGIYMILRNQELSFVGDGPFDERDQTIVGTWADEDNSEVGFALDSGELWVYDWQARAWSRWTPPVGNGDTITGAALVNGLPTYITQDAIYQVENGGAETFDISMTTAWIRLGALQGYQRVYNMWLYLELLAAHTLTVDMYLDGSETSVHTWTITSSGLGSTTPEQIRLSVPYQKCSAIKLKIASANAGWKLKGIMAEIGVKDSTFKSRNAPNNY
jgi:hypothetical protein